MTATVSVIIPAHNAASYLAQAIESVLGQTLQDWELVIVDDGSVDDTAALARTFVGRDPRIQLIQQANEGVSAARMTGFAHTSPGSTYVMFLDADDVIRPRALAMLRQAIEVSTDALGAHGLARFIDAEGRELLPGEAEAYGRSRDAIVDNRLVPWRADRPTSFRVLIFRNVIYTSGQVLLRRRALEMSGGYDRSLRMAEDWDLWLRLTGRGDLAFVDDVVMSYRRHEAAMANDRRAMARAIRQVRRAMTLASYLDDDQRRLARMACRLEQQENCRLQWTWARTSLARGELLSTLTGARRAVASGLRALSCVV